MLAGDWKQALDFLQSSAPGLTLEQCIDVLDGRKALAGHNTFTLELEPDLKVAQALDAEYMSIYNAGGYLKVGRRMYQAYSLITSLGAEDMAGLDVAAIDGAGTKAFPGWANAMESVDRKSTIACFDRTLLARRALHYASRSDDLAYLVRDAAGRWAVALFEEVATGTAPFWRERECETPQKAYEQLAAYLAEDGNCELHGTTLHALRLAQGEVSATHTDAAPSGEEAPPSLDEQLAAQAQRDAEFACEQSGLRAVISARADADSEYGWREFHWKSRSGVPLTLRVPGRAVVCYALSTTSAQHLMPAYEPVCEQGLKLADDNPFHSDAWVGAGFDVASAYARDEPHVKAFQALVSELQKELLGFQATVLARGPRFTGRVVFADTASITEHDILVVPHGSEEFHVQAMRAGAVICEQGGKLSHLVTVCREGGKPVVRVDGALAKFHLGQSLTLDTDNGTVEASALPSLLGG